MAAETKKFWARQIDGDYFDYEPYYSEDEAEYEHIWIGGNRAFKGFNKDLASDVLAALDRVDCNDDEDIKYGFAKQNGEELTGEELEFLKKLIKDYRDAARSEYEIVCDILGIIYGKPFDYGTIRGCCQGDWQRIIYPAGLKGEHISYIEAVYFGTGTEYEVTLDKVARDEVDDAEKSCVYSIRYNADDIKNDIAKQLRVNKDEIGLLAIKERRARVEYEYEEE